MELGNMIFGNSRGHYEVNRNLQDEWHSYMQECGFDTYGYHEQSDDDGIFQNDVFWIKPYYWGDCTCGFDELDYIWSKENSHSEDCYQSELEREKLAAGGLLNAEFGWIERPGNVTYDDWRKIERGIYSKLCAKHGLDPEFGCAVHCTCTYQSDYQAWREENSHAEICPIVMPNFWHKPSGFKLDWYKYPLRDSYSTEPLTRKMMRYMWAECKASLAQAIEAGTGETERGDNQC